MRRPEGTLTLNKRKADPTAMGSALNTGFLASSSVGFDTWELAHAQRWADALLACRDGWLLEKNRRLPSADQLERERYGNSLMRGRRNG
jgi:hypothetical protein